jgi:adenylyltransferase and sulfurtransferase
MVISGHELNIYLASFFHFEEHPASLVHFRREQLANTTSSSMSEAQSPPMGVAEHDQDDDGQDDVHSNTLQESIRRLQQENRRLRQELTTLRGGGGGGGGGGGSTDQSTNVVDTSECAAVTPSVSLSAAATVMAAMPQRLLPNGLTCEQIERYSRQLLLTDGFGVTGQVRLQQSSVLVVGAGGIGSTVLLYLAGAGVGRMGVMDFDVVEVSNLHRQVMHSMRNVGLNKAESACRAILNLNPSIECIPIPQQLTASNALRWVRDYDVVVDASDNPATRYVINDACVLAGKPLVSGSAVGTQGQLTVCNWNNGPCYRCLYPKPVVQTGCQSCSDAGVLGPVPGLIGTLQAMETLKVLTGFGVTMHNKLLMYDGAASTFFTVRKPARRVDCPVCGDHATIQSMEDSQRDIAATRGPGSNVASPPLAAPFNNGMDSTKMDADTNVTCLEYARIRELGQSHVLLDVRVEEQFAMCALPGAVNIPLARVPNELQRITALAEQNPIYCICRRGVASTQAVALLRELLPVYCHGSDDSNSSTAPPIRNIIGGLTAWQAQVDLSFPKY